MGEPAMLGRPPARAELSDAEALARVARGDLGALGVVYDRHATAVRRFAARATRDGEDVDDIVQNTFLTAAKAASRFDGALPCRPWLLGIATRLVLRRHRTLRQIARLLTGAAYRAPEHDDPSPRLAARADLRELDVALRRMSDAKRITFLLSEVEELSGEEIAAALDVPLNTVWTRLHAARRELRRALDESTEKEIRE